MALAKYFEDIIERLYDDIRNFQDQVADNNQNKNHQYKNTKDNSEKILATSKNVLDEVLKIITDPDYNNASIYIRNSDLEKYLSEANEKIDRLEKENSNFRKKLSSYGNLDEDQKNEIQKLKNSENQLKKENASLLKSIESSYTHNKKIQDILDELKILREQKELYLETIYGTKKAK